MNRAIRCWWQENSKNINILIRLSIINTLSHLKTSIKSDFHVVIWVDDIVSVFHVILIEIARLWQVVWHHFREFRKTKLDLVKMCVTSCNVSIYVNHPIEFCHRYQFDWNPLRSRQTIEASPEPISLSKLSSSILLVLPFIVIASDA